MDRHHVPHRGPRRHRPGHPQDPCGAERRRFVLDHRHQDLHQRRRARPRTQHRPHGAGAPAGCAARHQGHFAVPGAEVRARRGRPAGRAQRGAGRLDRTQDGHPRQRHLCARFRWRERLADRRGEQGPGRDVRDDEFGAAGRGHAVARPGGSRSPAGGRLCQGPSAEPLAERPAASGQAGRPHRRAPRRAPHAADQPRLHRGRARLHHLDRDADRPRTLASGRASARGSHRADGAADTGGEGLHHRQRLRDHQSVPAGVRRARLHRRMGVSSNTRATAAST